VHEIREERRLFEELRLRVELVREVYAEARGLGEDRIGAGLKALRAAVERQGRDQRPIEDGGVNAGQEAWPEDPQMSIADRLRGVLGRNEGELEPEQGPEDPMSKPDLNDRLKGVLGRALHGKDVDDPPRPNADSSKDKPPQITPDPDGPEDRLKPDEAIRPKPRRPGWD